MEIHLAVLLTDGEAFRLGRGVPRIPEKRFLRLAGLQVDGVGRFFTPETVAGQIKDAAEISPPVIFVSTLSVFRLPLKEKSERSSILISSTSLACL